MNLKLKALEEKRAEIVCKMEDMVKNIETEARTFSDGEEKEFDDSKKEVEKIDSTIKKTEEFRAMNMVKRESAVAEYENQETNIIESCGKSCSKMSSVQKSDIKTFANYIRNPIRNANFDVGSNGALIPVTIARQIIEAVRDICPIYSLAKVYNVKGELRIPYYMAIIQAIRSHAAMLLNLQN